MKLKQNKRNQGYGNKIPKNIYKQIMAAVGNRNQGQQANSFNPQEQGNFRSKGPYVNFKKDQPPKGQLFRGKAPKSSRNYGGRGGVNKGNSAREGPSNGPKRGQATRGSFNNPSSSYFYGGRGGGDYSQQ